LSPATAAGIDVAMTARSAIRLALAVALVGLVATGCTDDEPSMGGNGGNGNTPQTYTCSASISPGMFDYVVNGNQLTITTPTGTSTVNRVGTGGDVYGSWLLDEQRNPQLRMKVRLVLKLEADRASAVAECTHDTGARGTATASSAAEITDTSVTILESDERQVVFR